MKFCLKNTIISFTGMNGKTGDVAKEIIHVLPTNNQSNDQDSFNTFKLWKAQKKHGATVSRTFSSGKINHILDEILFGNLNFDVLLLNSTIFLYISISIKGEKKCPRNYELAPIQGDVPGPALISLGTTNIPADKERCAEICDHNSRCKSFLYSPTVGQCKITSHLDPTTNKTYRDWVMCSKKGR